MLRIITAIIFSVLLIVYYFFQFGTPAQTEVILTIATFLFATFTGFFMARQGARYTAIRQEIANFDGHITHIFRSFAHLGKRAEKETRKIIKAHYKPVVETGDWHYPFTHKTTTLTDLHALLDKYKSKYNDVKNLSLEYTINSLQALQVSRKQMINLHLERIPPYQWVLIIILGLILLLTVSALPTTQLIVPTILKAAFGTSIIVVLILLWEFDQLQFFEDQIGLQSAQDVMDILEGKK